MGFVMEYISKVETTVTKISVNTTQCLTIAKKPFDDP